MRLIDADALKEYFPDNGEGSWTYNVTVKAYIDAQPAIDSVIRCKDCKYSKAYYHGPESKLGMFTYLCTQGLYGMNAEDYCSRSERKEER